MAKYLGYAFLSNSMTSALELFGDICWFPSPRFDSPSLFSKILDENTGGHFSFSLDGKYDVSTSYVNNSLVVKNNFSSKSGKLQTIDFLPIGLPSIIRIFSSDSPFTVEITPTFNYGMINPNYEDADGGISFKNPASRESLDVAINGNYSMLEDGKFRFKPGKGSIFALYTKDYRQGLFSKKGYIYPKPEAALDYSLRYWESQMSIAKTIKHFKEAYYRSIAVVLGLIYAPSGGIIAASTTSIPPIYGEKHNWDYRYVWIRDASYAAEALAKAGFMSKARRIIEFMISVIDPSPKSFDHPLFEIDGTAPPSEEELGWLSGNHGSKPVRIGNAAYLQIQKDTEGVFVDALYTYFILSNDTSIIRENIWAIDAIAKSCSESWKNKSTSMWEERGTPQHFVHTKLMDWVAIDRISKLKRALGNLAVADSLEKISDAIKQDIIENGFSENLGSFVKYYGSNEVDAALLTMPIYGFINPMDRRFIGTQALILKRLMTRQGLLLRTENDYEGNNSHPFTLINTWLARVYTLQGKRSKAKEAIDNLIKFSTSLYLFGERADISRGIPMGNFPQLFPHAGLISAIIDYEYYRKA